jgi:hypothetical protein
MGGVHPGKYPPKLRLIALVQGFVLAAAAFVVLIKAELLLAMNQGVSNVAIWLVVALIAVSTFLNLITKSKWERRIWLPVTIVLLITSLVVAFG